MKAKPVIVSFLAVVAVLAAVSVYISMTVDRAEKAVVAFASPDGKYKAVKITMTGRGSSPFCFDSISLVFAAYPDSFAERDKAYEIYSGPCGSFANREPSPKIEWLSATALQITFSKGSGGLNKRKENFKTLDVTKTVQVTFVTHE